MAFTTGARQVFTMRDHKAHNAKVSVYVDTTYSANAAAGHIIALGQDLYAMYTGDTKFLLDGVTPIVQCNGIYTSPAQAWNGTFNSSGAYHDIEDKAAFTFMDISGSRHVYQVPAPLTSMFLADQETIDTSQTVVKQFIADMLAATYSGTAPNVAATKPIVNASGLALKSFVAGFRIRRKLQRKTTIFTRNPAETGPAE